MIKLKPCAKSMLSMHPSMWKLKQQVNVKDLISPPVSPNTTRLKRSNYWKTIGSCGVVEEYCDSVNFEMEEEVEETEEMKVYDPLQEPEGIEETEENGGTQAIEETEELNE